MTIHANFIEDNSGDLVDIEWYCSGFCFTKAGHTHVGAYPCGTETDYDVHCGNCGDLIWEGLEYEPSR